MSQWNQKTRRTRRPRRIEEVSSAEVGFPIAWIIIGALSGLLVIGLVGLGAVNILRKQAITPTPSAIPGLAATQSPVDAPISADDGAAAGAAGAAATPTIPPVVTLAPTPTLPPTVTPVPTLPEALAPDIYAKVIETGSSGLSMRAGPGTNNARLNVAPENSIIFIAEGPRADENQQDYIWWFIRDQDGNEGWVVQDFLEPSLPPEALENSQ